MDHCQFIFLENFFGFPSAWLEDVEGCVCVKAESTSCIVDLVVVEAMWSDLLYGQVLSFTDMKNDAPWQ